MSRAYDNAADGRYQQGGRRNLIINGAMQVAQRGTSFSGVSSSQYLIDRWQLYQAGGVGTHTQESDAPSDFYYSWKHTVTTADDMSSFGNVVSFAQKIEGQDLTLLNYGSANAKNLILSFWVKSSVTGVYTLEVLSGSASYMYATTYEINSANTWEKKEVTISGDTTNALENVNASLGLQFIWSLASSDEYNGGTFTPDTWQSYNQVNRVSNNQVNLYATVGNTFYITGVQLEVGTVATPFEHRSYQDEFLACCRYYQECRGLSTTAGYQNGTSQVIYDIPLFVPLRAQPTVSYVNRSTRVAQTAVSTSDGMGTAFSGGTISSYDYSDYVQYGATLQLRMNFSSSVGGSDNTPIFIWPYHTMQINSEL